LSWMTYGRFQLGILLLPRLNVFVASQPMYSFTMANLVQRARVRRQVLADSGKTSAIVQRLGVSPDEVSAKNEAQSEMGAKSHSKSQSPVEASGRQSAQPSQEASSSNTHRPNHWINLSAPVNPRHQEPGTMQPCDVHHSIHTHVHTNYRLMHE